MTINANNEITTTSRPLLETGCDVFIRLNQGVDILHKVRAWNESLFSEYLTSQKPFGLPTTYNGANKQTATKRIAVFGRNQSVTYCSRDEILANGKYIDQYKVFLAAAYGERISNNYYVTGKPFIGKPLSACSETYIAFTKCKNEEEANNVISYIQTKFFRFLVLLHKPTQHLLKSVYDFVPVQDFSKPWTDKELYEKYGITDEEIEFIDSMIRPMDLGGSDDAE